MYLQDDVTGRHRQLGEMSGLLGVGAGFMLSDDRDVGRRGDGANPKRGWWATVRLALQRLMRR